jgi:hypothetical protein
LFRLFTNQDKNDYLSTKQKDYESHLPDGLSTFAAVLLSLPLFLNSCKKTITDQPITPVTPPICDTCLPEITSAGKGTFGCKVNGKNWLPEGGLLTPEVYASYGQSKILDFFAQNVNSVEKVVINIGGVSDTGYYSFPDSRFNICKAYYNKIKDGVGYLFYYQSDKIDNGFLHITHFEFSPTGFVSGTFAFDLYQNDFKDTIHITDGRFDIRF